MQRYKLSTFIIVFIFVNSILGLQCPVGFDSMPPGVPLGICVIVGCSKPIKDQLCSENCIEGYTKTQSQSCQVLKCTSNSKSLCSACQSGYQLKVHPLNPILRICVPSNCLSINRITRQCNICQQGFILQKNGTCKFANCQVLSRLESQCEKCLQEYVITKIGEGLNACIPKNCIKSSSQTYNCQVCQQGFSLTETGTCKLGINNCEEFNSFSGLCYKCSQGYRVIALKACVKIDQFCQQYQTKGCVKCVTPYKAKNGICEPNYCEQSDPQNRSQCIRCQIGFRLNPQNLCQIQNCQNFDKKTWSCLKCYDMFDLVSVASSLNTIKKCATKFCDKLDKVTLQCLECNKQYTLNKGNCFLSNCIRQKQIKCQQCMEGWKQNQNGNCVLHDCLQFINPTNCKSCEAQKRLYKGTCIKDNCLFRTPDGSCGQCTALLIIHDKFPQYCVVPFCQKIDQSSGDCLQCLPNFKFNEDKFCQSILCQKFQNKTGFVWPQCTKCIEGYEPKQNYCIAEKKYCSQYSFETGKCLTCPPLYQKSFDNSTCKPLKCKNFQKKSSYSICQQCSLGYQLINLQDGTQKCVVNNCTKFQDNSCKQCAPGYSILQDICIAANCDRFSSKGFCINCQDGFYLNSTTLTCSRIKCLQDTIESCLKCQQGYFIDQSETLFKGLCLPFNCLTVKYTPKQSNSPSTIKCIKCQPDFILMPLQKCVATNCKDIDKIKGNCNQCRPGFKLFPDGKCYYQRNNQYCPDRRYPNQKFICEAIKATNCFSANPKNTNQCYRCNDGFWLNKGVCIPFTACIQKNPYLGCLQCQLGYQVNQKTGQCQGSIPNCQLYNTETSQCQKCSRNYQIVLYPNKTCKQIPNYCLLLDANGKCSQCKSPNHVLNSENACILQTSNCMEYDLGTGFCTKCESNYYEVKNSQGVTSCKSNPINCLSVKPSSAGQCTKCADNYILNLGICYRTIEGCITYNLQKCTRCQSGYFVDSKGLRCLQLPRFCQKVILGTDGACEQCREKYIGVFGVCYRQIDFCANYDPSSGKCLRCRPGYSLTNNQLLCLLGEI